MKRFLSTTAMVAVMGGAAMAQTENAGWGDVTLGEGDFYASDLIGMRIYNSETEYEADARVAADASQEWEDIGEINDIILSADGEVRAVILGVGGFLGLGERDVSVSMDEIRVVYEDGDSDDRFLVVNTTVEELEGAPAYERDMEAMAENAETEVEQETAEVAAEVEEETAEAAAEVEQETAEIEAEVEQETAEAEAEMEQETAELGTAMDREPLPRPMVERDGYQTAEEDLVAALTAEELEGSYVYGANDETVGEIDTLVLTDDGQVSEVVINVGGFLGIGEKPVAVTFAELQILKNVEGDDFRIYIDSTEERLEALPEFEAN